ncbi:MAG: glucose-1-phosphate adenylyltransferase subunit GlgD [Clostridia bacterium]|nr:glucose-1-phosphate adenylyltransferase subunit GlgD [Clostridia bacterium]MBR2944630.1 glucose-1-phosphate adenylyltransferase subunit GlgD [Clostridia bacterium]
MSTAGIIFSNIHDNNIPELTRNRTMASVPFGCRYRLIDFALSNMVNSNINNVSVITHYNYQSLMDHIGSGKDWDLARRSGGIKILPPFIRTTANSANQLYTTRLEALKSVNYAISKITDDYVVLSDCDVICNIDLNDMIKYHKANDADLTMAVKKVNLTKEQAKINVLVDSNSNGEITDVQAYPTNFEGEADINLNIMVMTRQYLQEIVEDSIAHNYTSLTKDIILRGISRKTYRTYRYDGYFACISSSQDYYASSMELIKDKDVRKQLFGVKNRPVYTKVRNSAPTYYSPEAKVTNSLIADGCEIFGEVENSILFRGTKIGKGTKVKNSILFQDTYTGENVVLNCVIADKNVVVRDNKVLSGDETLPFYLAKGKMI